MKLILSVLLFAYFTIDYRVAALKCYGCASSLPADTDEDARTTAKTIIAAKFVLPEVSDFCDKPEDPEFPSVMLFSCPKDDVCAKLTYQAAGLKFVIRGCRTFIFKGGIPQSEPCDQTSSPSICYCDTDRCNSSPRLISPSSIVILLTAIFLIVDFVTC